MHEWVAGAMHHMKISHSFWVLLTSVMIVSQELSTLAEAGRSWPHWSVFLLRLLYDECREYSLWYTKTWTLCFWNHAMYSNHCFFGCLYLLQSQSHSVAISQQAYHPVGLIKSWLQIVSRHYQAVQKSGHSQTVQSSQTVRSNQVAQSIFQSIWLEPIKCR